MKKCRTLVLFSAAIVMSAWLSPTEQARGEDRCLNDTISVSSSSARALAGAAQSNPAIEPEYLQPSNCGKKWAERATCNKGCEEHGRAARKASVRSSAINSFLPNLAKDLEAVTAEVQTPMVNATCTDPARCQMSTCSSAWVNFVWNERKPGACDTDWSKSFSVKASGEWVKGREATEEMAKAKCGDPLFEKYKDLAVNQEGDDPCGECGFWGYFQNIRFKCRERGAGDWQCDCSMDVHVACGRARDGLVLRGQARGVRCFKCDKTLVSPGAGGSTGGRVTPGAGGTTPGASEVDPAGGGTTPRGDR